MSSPSLPPSLNAKRRRRLAQAVEAAYSECRLRFDRNVGFDSQTFGQMVYKSSWFHLEQYLKDDPGVRIDRDFNSFEIEIEGAVLHPYKLGQQEGDFRDRFPSNEAVFAFMAERNVEQIQLFPSTPPAKLILAHCGNAIDGLRAVYVAAPIRAEDGSFGWAFAVRIDDLEVRVNHDLPAPVSIELPELRDVEPRKERDAQPGDD